MVTSGDKRVSWGYNIIPVLGLKDCEKERKSMDLPAAFTLVLQNVVWGTVFRDQNTSALWGLKNICFIMALGGTYNTQML